VGKREFTRSLHNGNRIDKEVLQAADMNIDSPPEEENSLMLDWSPCAARPVYTETERGRDAFTRSQRAKLLQLRDELTECVTGVVKGSRSSEREASPCGTHQADAASDAYECDFALRLLSHEQDALYEIDEALHRIELGTYGVCEISGKPIPRVRLEAIPFARFIVECQSQREREKKVRPVWQRILPHFGLMNTETEEERHEGEEVRENAGNQFTAA
jgi:RNA polymerase-binding transcription factor DksA